MSQSCQLRKYGVQFTVDFELYETDGVALRTDWVPAQADCEVMKDGGASTQCDNTATDEGSTYSIVITATEAEAARLVLKIVDVAGAAFLDKVVIIETYGNASAQHAFDFDTATVDVTGLAQASAAKLDDILDGTGGTGLYLSTLVVTGADLGFDINGLVAAAKFTGGTTGVGIDINGGSSSGNGITIDSTSGSGMSITTASGTGLGITTSSGTAMAVVGTTLGLGVIGSAGDAVQFTSSGGNGDGLAVTGNGSGHGLLATGGATGNGIRGLGGATSGAGLYGAAQNNNDSGIAAVANGTGDDLAADNIASSDQVDAIGTAGGAALAVDANDDNYDGGISGVTSGTTKTGTQTATYAATSVADGTAHVMAHDTKVVGIVYQFQAGGGTSPVTIEWLGLLNPINDTLTLQVWDHVGGAWETLGTRAGQTSTTSFTPKTLVLYARHMGTSVAELGNVYLQLLSSENYDHIVRTDQVYVNYAVTARTVGYADGAVWVDSGGTAGAVDYVNATADNPAPWANALTVAASLGLTRFHIANDETVTLGAAFDDKTMYGEHYYLKLGGQSINDSAIIGATISGVGSASDHTVFDKCDFIIVGTDSPTTGPGIFRLCGFNTSVTYPFVASGTGEAVFVDCFSMVAGAGTPYYNFTALTGGVNIRRYAGGSHVTLDSANTLSLEVLAGGGQTVVTGGADVEIRGICRAVTITATAAETIQFVGTTGPITLGDDGASTATINLYGVASSVTDNTNGATVTDATTTGADGGVVLADGAHGGSSAVLTLKNAVITGADLGLDINGNVAAMKLSGGTTGIGLDVNGGSSSGNGITIDSTSGSGMSITTASGTGLGITTSSGTAMAVVGTTLGLGVIGSAGDAVQFTSSGGNGDGLAVTGNGSGHGIIATGGATGNGLDLNGGSSSGSGLDVRSTSGDAVYLLAGGGDGWGINATGEGSGGGIAASSAGTGPGFLAQGYEMGNSDGMQLTGTGTGHGLLITGGATGNGARILGGATSGAGLYAAAQNNNDAGAQFVKNGTGNDITGDTASFITANNLDHLMKTAVANNADMTTEVADGTVLSNIMSATSNTSTFVVADDSLEAISVAVAGVSVSTSPLVLQTTTIATLASQTSFTLTAGSTDDDPYNNMVAVITDSATSAQKAVARISDYAGATKTVTLGADPGIFTMAAGDAISILAWHPYLDASVASVGGGGGSGAVTHTVTVEDDDSNPLDGAEVWMTTDVAGSNVSASTTSNALGKAVFLLDAGTYYRWIQLSGYNFTNPTTEVVA